MENLPIGVPESLNRIPGFRQYCFEPTCRLSFASAALGAMLEVPEASLLKEDADGYAPFVHPEDREEYENFLRRPGTQNTCNYRLISATGRILYVIDTLTTFSIDGRLVAQSVLTDVTSQQLTKSQQETSRYLQALSEVYDKIFEFDYRTHTVTCVYGQKSPSFQWIQNVPMEMEQATENWITSTAAPEDQQPLRAFFRGHWHSPTDRPARIFYHARSSSGMQKPYAGLFLKLEEQVHLFCCRCCQNEQEAAALRQENDSLKSVQKLAMEFTEGMMAFEMEDNRVKPLYTSENVCSFFGYTQEQWGRLAECRPTIREFVANSGIAYGDIVTLFSRGEAEFPYFDIHRNAYRRIRAICSRKYDGTGKCYVMLYRMDAPREEPRQPLVNIRTFGYFDVFVGEKPIAFRNEKAKELFALLVDRKGGFVTSEEAIGFLWEDEPANALTMARYRKVALRLKNTLDEYGVAEVMESVNGKRRLIPERVKCDLYDYLSGEEAYAQLFKGSYLTNYSWGESTLAEMTGAYLYGPK